jgi:hypothetical protein
MTMNKPVKAFLFRSFCLLNLVLLAACGSSKSTSSSQTPVLSSAASSLPEKTSYRILEHGVSEYVIALPENPSTRLSFAANELTHFFSLATGYELPSLEASKVPSGDPVISLGINALSSSYVSALEKQDLGSSSYCLKTEGKNLFILGKTTGDDEGILYGVYDFMADAFGYRCYAEDEIAYDTVETIPLYSYDKIVSPSFENRSLGYRSLMDDTNYLQRMRLLDQYHDTRWGVYGHSQIGKFLPYETYFKEHPDWYANESESYYNGRINGQLCWCAGEAMEAEFTKNLITYIEKYPTAIYFHLAQEDDSNYCQCEKCVAAKQEYALNNAGLQLVFANHIAARIDDYLKAKNSTREIKLVLFAYQGTIEPPTVKNADGSYRIYNDKLKLNDRIMIYFTPIGLDFSRDFSSTANLQYGEDLKGWKVLAEGKLLTYLYDTNFHNYFINFNNFDTVPTMYKDLQNAGVRYLYSQGPVDTVTPSLESMRIYVESRLLWDTSLTYDNLVNDFFAHYFKDAANAMRKYYDLTRNREAYYMNAVDQGLGGIYGSIGTSEMWTEDVVSALASTLDEALTAIAGKKDSDPTLYETLKNRIMKEYLTVIYLKLTLYSDRYSSEQIALLKKDFKTYTSLWNISRTVESGNLEGLDE